MDDVTTECECFNYDEFEIVIQYRNKIGKRICWIDFMIYLIDKREAGIFYKKVNDCLNSYSIQNRDHAQVFAYGNIKFDGCSNWHFEEQDHVMMHFCGRNDALILNKIINAIYDIAKNKMGDTWIK